MIRGLKLLLYEDDYLLGLQKRAVDNDRASVRMWVPGSRSPSSQPPPLHLQALPLHQHQLLSNLCRKLMQGAGVTLTSPNCRRTDEVPEDQLFGWAGVHPSGGKARAQQPGLLLLFTFYGTISYRRLAPLLCQYVSVLVNKGRSHIAVESTTVPSQMRSWPSVWLHTPCAIANTIISGLLKYRELKAGKS